MRCIVCDRCKKIIENPRSCRVITCAKPLKLPINDGKTTYRGNDRQYNDIIWEKEICSDCQDALEAFLEQEAEPTEPDDSETTADPDEAEDGDGEQEP